jgi:hypothetical protein
MAASKFSQNNFIPEKYKTLESLKLHFLQNSPVAQKYISVSDCIVVGNIPQSHFVRTFTALLSHS